MSEAAPAPPAIRRLPASGPRRFDWLGLLWTIVRTDFKVRYQGTIGGFVWALLKPIVMFLVLLTVFSFVFPQEDYSVNLLLGLFIWDFFAAGTMAGLVALDAKSYLLTKSRIPRWVIVATSCSNPLITLAVTTSTLLLYLALQGRLGLLPLLAFLYDMLMLLVIVVGFSLGASVLFLRYRDLNQVWEVCTNAGFFVAPVIYPLATLPEKYHLLLYLWPPTPVIEFSRAALVAGKLPTVAGMVDLTAVALVTLGAGGLVFRKLAPGIAERL